MRRHLILFCLAWSLSGATEAAVDRYCVGSNTDLQNLANQLNAQLLINDLDIRIRPGTFTWTPPVAGQAMFRIRYNRDFQVAPTVRISGQWNADCSVQSHPGTAFTRIDALAMHDILWVSDGWNIAGGGDNPPLSIDLQVDQLFLYRAQGIAVHHQIVGGEVVLRHVRVSHGQGRALSTSTSDGILVHDSLFENNQSDFALLYVESQGSVQITNNTLRNNTLTAFGGNIKSALVLLGASSSQGLAMFANNIVWNNALCSATCFEVQADFLSYVEDNILTRNVAGTPIRNLNNHNIDPRFVTSSGALLNSDSPARDLGNPDYLLAHGKDFYGNPRVQNQVIDLGAHELSPQVLGDAVFAGGFE